ncbi:hypothetical protein [Corallococcus sp. CA053C]|uniref:hypothetical protein n=1 Tax=Corallococcus sp. CA053C TaxID=2316732 RepID=UPI0011C48A05|nr:hypothetical protein [Corallococcus sp. CA053C]
MSWSIEVPAVNTLNRPLGDSSQEQALGRAECSVNRKVPLPGGSVLLGASLKVPVELFNGPEDKDAGGVVGKRSADAPDGSTPEPLFLPDGITCWLKYAAELNAEASAEGSLPFLTLDGKGAINVRVADYRGHPTRNLLGDTLREDAKTLRLPFQVDDVRALGPDDALAFQARIQLKTGATLSWPIVTAAVVTALAKRVGRAVALQLKADVGLSVGGSLQLEDELCLVFSRPKNPGPFTVSVRKATSHGGAVKIEAGATLGVESPVLTALLTSVASTEQAQEVSKVMEALEAGKLSPTLLTVATALLGGLGFKEELDATQTTVEKVYGELKTLIKDSVCATLKAGFEYEYARCTEDTTLMELEVPEASLGDVHEALISGDLARIQRQVKDAWTRRYFQMTSIETQRTRSFGLGWRDVFLAKSEDSKKLKAVAQHASRDHVNGPRRYAFQGARSYKQEGWLAGAQVLQGIDFSAQMPGFSTRPSADAFAYAFFAQSRFQGSPSLQWLEDTARVWGALPDGGSPERLTALVQAAPRGTRITARFELRIDSPTFKKLLKRMGTDPAAELDCFAIALARALPWESVALRASPAVRQQIYAPLWKKYLMDRARNWDKASILRGVDDRLKRMQPPAALQNRTWEQSAMAGGAPTPATFMGVMENASRYGGDVGGRPYGKVYEIWARLTQRLQALQQAIDARSPLSDDPEHSIIVDAFDPLEDSGSDGFRLTATVAWFLELSRHWGFRADLQPLVGIKVGDQPELLLTSV